MSLPAAPAAKKSAAATAVVIPDKMANFFRLAADRENECPVAIPDAVNRGGFFINHDCPPTASDAVKLGRERIPSHIYNHLWFQPSVPFAAISVGIPESGTGSTQMYMMEELLKLGTAPSSASAAGSAEKHNVDEGSDEEEVVPPDAAAAAAAAGLIHNDAGGQNSNNDDDDDASSDDDGDDDHANNNAQDDDDDAGDAPVAPAAATADDDDNNKNNTSTNAAAPPQAASAVTTTTTKQAPPPPKEKPVVPKKVFKKLCGLAMHFDSTAQLGGNCDHIISMCDPNATDKCVDPNEVVILVSPTNPAARDHYENAGFTVQQLKYSWQQLTVDQIMALLGVEVDKMPPYADAVLAKLHDWQSKNNKRVPFSEFFKAVVSTSTFLSDEQQRELARRVARMAPFVGDDNDDTTFTFHQTVVANKRRMIICDLSDPMLTSAFANDIFFTLLSAFRALEISSVPYVVPCCSSSLPESEQINNDTNGLPGGKFVAFSDIHKYLGASPRLAREVVRTIESKRKENTRVIITSAMASSVPAAIWQTLDCILVHMIHSVEEWDFICRQFPFDHKLLTQILTFRARHVLVGGRGMTITYQPDRPPGAMMVPAIMGAGGKMVKLPPPPIFSSPAIITMRNRKIVNNDRTGGAGTEKTQARKHHLQQREQQHQQHLQQKKNKKPASTSKHGGGGNKGGNKAATPPPPPKPTLPADVNTIAKLVAELAGKKPNARRSRLGELFFQRTGVKLPKALVEQAIDEDKVHVGGTTGLAWIAVGADPDPANKELHLLKMKEKLEKKKQFEEAAAKHAAEKEAAGEGEGGEEGSSNNNTNKENTAKAAAATATSPEAGAAAAAWGPAGSGATTAGASTKPVVTTTTTTTTVETKKNSSETEILAQVVAELQGSEASVRQSRVGEVFLRRAGTKLTKSIKEKAITEGKVHIGGEAGTAWIAVGADPKGATTAAGGATTASSSSAAAVATAAAQPKKQAAAPQQQVSKKQQQQQHAHHAHQQQHHQQHHQRLPQYSQQPQQTSSHQQQYHQQQQPAQRPQQYSNSSHHHQQQQQHYEQQQQQQYHQQHQLGQYQRPQQQQEHYAAAPPSSSNYHQPQAHQQLASSNWGPVYQATW